MNKAYMILLEIGQSIIKAVCYAEDIEKSFESDTKSISVSFLRGIGSSAGQFTYSEIFLFTSEENYVINKSRVIGFSELSTTHSVAFMDYINRTTNFSKSSEIPYFENLQLLQQTKN